MAAKSLRAGHEVAVVMGSQHNIKITTPADLELAEFWRGRVRVSVMVSRQ